MKIALDTNILVYAEGLNGPERRQQVADFLENIRAADVVLPIQVLGEFFNVLSRRSGWTRDRVRAATKVWLSTYEHVATSAETLSCALDLAVDHQLSTWDAIILAAASGAGCGLLLSEDMHHGFAWGGVTVVNPFAEPRHPLLDAALH